MEKLIQIGQSQVNARIFEQQGYKNNVTLYLQNDFANNTNYLQCTINGSEQFDRIVRHTRQFYVFKIDLNLHQLERYYEVQSPRNFIDIIQDTQDDYLYVVAKYTTPSSTEERDIIDYMRSKGADIIVNDNNIDLQLYKYFAVFRHAKCTMFHQTLVDNDLELEIEYNQKEDLGQVGFGDELIQLSNRDFEFSNERKLLAEINDIKGKYLIVNGLVQKVMNTYQNVNDAEIRVVYQTNSGEVVDKSGLVQSLVYSNIQLVQEVPQNTQHIKIYLYCLNHATVPGVVKGKSFQAMWQDNKFVTQPNPNENHLIQISNKGIEIDNFAEGIGFNPLDPSSYKKEYLQKNNLFKNIRLPVIVDEPVKWFDEIIDSPEHHIVSKAYTRKNYIDLPPITIQAHKQYLIGMWIANKQKQQCVINLLCDTQQQVSIAGFGEGEEIIKTMSQSIMLDHEYISENNESYKFYCGFVFPYGQRLEDYKSLYKLSEKMVESIQWIATTTPYYEMAKFFVPVNKGELTLNLKVQTEQFQENINTVVVYPVVKELDILSLRKDLLTTIELDEELNK